MSTNLSNETGTGVKLKKRSYILYYHYRLSKPQELGFEMMGRTDEEISLKKAIERGQRHCLTMNYKFIKVRPFIVDLDEREKRRNDEGFFEEAPL